MALALCERLPAPMLLAYNNTLPTLSEWVEPFQHIADECFCRAHADAPSQMALSDGLKMKHLFPKCTVYNDASVSLLTAVLYLSSPGFLRASQPLRSSPALRPAGFPPPPPPPLSSSSASERLTPSADYLVSAKHH